MSPFPPPIAGLSLVNAKESLIVDCNVESKFVPKNVTVPEDNIVRDCAVTLEVAPPPTRYSTVKVVFEGANP